MTLWNSYLVWKETHQSKAIIKVMSAALERRESFEQNGPLPVRREYTDMITVIRDQISATFKVSKPYFYYY